MKSVVAPEEQSLAPAAKARSAIPIGQLKNRAGRMRAQTGELNDAASRTDSKVDGRGGGQRERAYAGGSGRTFRFSTQSKCSARERLLVPAKMRSVIEALAGTVPDIQLPTVVQSAFLPLPFQVQAAARVT